MVTVVSPFLLAVGATWDEGPEAGEWIADRLGPFGPTVGHAVPLGYPAYAIVPIPWDEDAEDALAPVIALEALFDVLDPHTGAQPVHSGMWLGFGWWYDAGEDPRTAPGMAAGVFWPAQERRPTQEAIDRELAQARERLVGERVERPDAEALELPERSYALWTGPLRSALAFRHQANSPPSLIWPEDRAWFVGAPIYTNEIAVAGPIALIEDVVDDTRLDARRATPADTLDGED